jgi:phospholipid transport system substrate-binding protein
MRRVLAALGLGVVVGVAPAAVVSAGMPAEQLQDQIRRVLAILEDESLRTEARASERRAAIRKAAEEIFDIEEMSRRSLGRHWSALTADDQGEFVRLFADILDRAYLAKIVLYRVQRFAVVGDSIDRDHATVKTRIATRETGEIGVEYRLLRRQDRWMTYDIHVEGVSLLANYRSQFDRIFQSSGREGLFRRLRASLQESKRP